MIQLIQTITLIVGSLIGAYTDYKTGYIFDWITLPMIVIGFVLSFIAGSFLNIIIAGIIFLAMIVLYYAGKLGGGDVKFFTGIALLNPFNNVDFIITALFFSAISATIFYSTYYFLKLLKEKINFRKIVKNKNETIKAIVLIGIAFAYVLFMYFFGIINVIFVIVLIMLVFCLVIVFFLQEEIIKRFFEKKIKIEELEEDEIVSINGNPKKVFEILGLKKVIGRKEAQELKKQGIKRIVVLRNLPKFGPFIFLGVCIALIMPDFFRILIL